jgi:hypothetical protein
LVALAPRHSGGRGFGPYLAFILENVFLRFDSRVPASLPAVADAVLWANLLCCVRRTQGYMRPNEKWKVANAALKIFHEVRSHLFSLKLS